VYAVNQGVKRVWFFEMAEMEARESEIMRKIWGADEEFWVMMFSRHRRMAWSYTDAVFRCLKMKFSLPLRKPVLFFRSDWIRL